MRDAAVEALVLGCTHYPLLRGAIAAELPGVALVDSADAIAAEVAERLGPVPGAGAHRFYVTDTPERFLRVARRFLGSDVPAAEQVDI
jgi:glutamate racemase